MDIDEERKRKIWIAIAYTMYLISAYFYKYIYKEPCMTSILTGEMWVKEVLTGNPIRCVNAFRMEPQLFLRLCNDLSTKYGLKASCNMSIREKVGIFLYALAQGVSNRLLGERFQRSGDTISRAFHDVLNSISCRAIKGLAHDIIRPYDQNFTRVPAKIATDTRYMPYFKDSIGCIDGTHIEACIPEALQMPYRGRKGIPTFNVLAVCDFDMCFTFVSAGWEGSAHDTRVFLNAIQNPAFKFPKAPEGKYYLADKGYPDRKGYLIPYPKTRYHKSQFEYVPPKNDRETFNRWHSSLRSCIERCFGVLKQRWKILTKMPQYSIEKQIHIIVATFALHNYIRINSPDDPLFRVLEEYPNFIPSFELPDVRVTSRGENGEESCTEMKAIRDRIADALWKSRNERRRI
ncbi:uncharacterized protein [Spinacia oleracea]|uniref:DDE Tnp4 domain-containing protein n=1 Tax=Spinacia oleracea TaxID=3562 RepID=A0A9R0JYG4_SPIOL|nr:uncharacterized protein LOC110791293 [Spinacia oleracea]